MKKLLYQDTPLEKVIEYVDCGICRGAKIEEVQSKNPTARYLGGYQVQLYVNGEWYKCPDVHPFGYMGVLENAHAQAAKSIGMPVQVYKRTDLNEVFVEVVR